MNAPTATLMSGDDYRESLRRYKPRVFLDGQLVDSVADERGFGPGINAIALTYDYALKPQYAPVMTALQQTSGKRVNRLTHINTSSGDLLNKLEAVRLVCQETGCAQRYLTHDALNAIGQVSARIDDARGTSENTARFLNYLHRVQDQDLTLGIAMTDAKGDRSKRPHAAGQPRQLPAHRGAQRQRHRHQRHQGHRHRRALHARAAGHAVPQHGL